MSEAYLPTAEGRLRDAEMTLGTDPRLDPRLGVVMRRVGAAGASGDLPVGRASARQDLLDFGAAVEQSVDTMYEAALEGLTPLMGEYRTLDISGRDGNTVPLYVHEPKLGNGPNSHIAGEIPPIIVHFHGGGMVMGSAKSDVYIGWRTALADAGLAVVGIEYRNAAGRLGPFPFPAGLHDCIDGVRWVITNRESLGGGPIMLSGESGGANLAAAVALSANRDGWAGEIGGVFLQCPYIAGPEVWDFPESGLESLRENDGYLHGVTQFAVMAELYDPERAHVADPLCWPLRASEKDMKGLPPHVIEVNELDPVRDEGIAYYRRLQAAGVDAVGRVLLGVPHAGDVLFGRHSEHLWNASVAAVTGFARSLAVSDTHAKVTY